MEEEGKEAVESGRDELPGDAGQNKFCSRERRGPQFKVINWERGGAFIETKVQGKKGHRGESLHCGESGRL